MMLFFQTTLGKILIWQKFSGMWESDFKFAKESLVSQNRLLNGVHSIWNFHGLSYKLRFMSLYIYSFYSFMLLIFVAFVIRKLKVV